MWILVTVLWVVCVRFHSSVASFWMCTSASSCRACVSPTEQQSHPDETKGAGSPWRLYHRHFHPPGWHLMWRHLPQVESKAGGSRLHQGSQEQMEKAAASLGEAPLQGCPGLYHRKISFLRTILEISAKQITGRQWSQHGAGLWAVVCCGMHRQAPWQEWVHSHC